MAAVACKSTVDRREPIVERLLALFLHTSTRDDYLAAVVRELEAWTGCRCIGIRITRVEQRQPSDGQDEPAASERRIPYAASVGFGQEFCAHEGNLSLETDRCLCMRVVLGQKLASDSPLVTGSGSLRADNLARFVCGLTDQDACEYRGHCVKVGFKSVAVIPVHYRDQIVGAIHLADERENLVSADKVEFLETVAMPLVGEAVHRFAVEADLADHRAHLEEMVRQRTAELEAANQELEAFAYSVSHDLRAPLRAIEGYCQAVIEDAAGLDDQCRQRLDRILTASQRMGQLISDLLRLSRVTRSPLVRERVNLSKLVSRVAGELAEREPSRTVEFGVQPEVWAHADERLMYIVLENLLGNAWKFTSKHAKARIEFGSTAGPDGRTEYFIRDDGAGFDSAYAQRLFAPFQRLHGASEFAGNGVGLATVFRIIRRHGGQVLAEGAVEKGATVRFWI